MPSITVTNQPVYGRNLIQINWSDEPSVQFARVIRIASDGTEMWVRAHTFADTDGYSIELSAGLAVLYDTEAPMDVPVSYRTESDESSSTATTSQSVLMSGNDMWLKAPLRPWADQRVTQGTPGVPDCVPEGGIYFGGMATDTRPNRSGIIPINNRRNPISAARTRGGIQSSMLYVSRRFVDRDAMIELNAPGDALLFQAPAAYGIPDHYQWVDTYQINRLSNDHRKQWRTHTMPYTEVDRPPGLAEGVLGNRWVDLCDPYATFGDAEAAGQTWTNVLLGQATNPPIPGFRLYSDIPVDFATYADIPTGGRTYEDLMEDR
jgi:hypothetical protein